MRNSTVCLYFNYIFAIGDDNKLGLFLKVNNHFLTCKILIHVLLVNTKIIFI